jgi:hypothetical protein
MPQTDLSIAEKTVIPSEERVRNLLDRGRWMAPALDLTPTRCFLPEEA